MRSGARRQPIEIRRLVQMGVSGTLGEPNFVWQTWRDIFAQVDVRRGREHYDSVAKKRISEEVWRFIVRYEEVVGIDPTMVIFHNGMTFDIKAPLPDGQFQRDVVIEATVQNKVLEGEALHAFMENNVPEGAVGVPLSFVVNAKGGAEPYSFSLLAGTLPTGLSLNTATGVVSGTPAVAGTWSGIVIAVEDSAGDVTSLPAITLTIAE